MDQKDALDTVDAVRARWPDARPAAALILGSGWGNTLEAWNTKDSLDYAAIPGLGRPGVAGHQGRLLLAEVAGREILVFLGRRHYYEGAGWGPVTWPVRLAAALGASVMVLTNAAGGVRQDLAPGSLMLITDHLNLMGSNPLIGPHQPWLGPRFPAQGEVYDRALLAWTEAMARENRVPLSLGVYAAVSGPTYETPAEVRALRALGADAVGMSTVPEAMLAHAAGLRVVAVSVIANAAEGTGSATLSHSEVLATAELARPRCSLLLGALVRHMATQPPLKRPGPA